LLQLPLQQSHEPLQLIVESLQMSPSGLQPDGFRHTPRLWPGTMLQVTGVPEPPGRPAEPQQSPSFVHVSPTTWQPLAGRQTSTPVGPYGAQRRLQQSPPQEGTSPSAIAVPPSAVDPAHSIPSTAPQLLVPVASGAQSPRNAFDATLHVPLQQSALTVHVSPVWPQNDGTEHTPPWQSSEQHSPETLHALPRVLQVGLSAAHVPLTHEPPQHSPSEEHGSSSEMHDAMLQTPFAQFPLQQSHGPLHAAPSFMHAPASPHPEPESTPASAAFASTPASALAPSSMLASTGGATSAMFASTGCATSGWFASTGGVASARAASTPPSTVPPASMADAPSGRFASPLDASGPPASVVCVLSSPPQLTIPSTAKAETHTARWMRAEPKIGRCAATLDLPGRAPPART
jgi:hypothetical protein